MPQEHRNDLLAYLVDKVEELVREAGVAGAEAATAILAEAQELLALHTNIVRRSKHAALVEAQLDLPFERKAA